MISNVRRKTEVSLPIRAGILPGCPNYDDIRIRNLVIFQTKREQ